MQFIQAIVKLLTVVRYIVMLGNAVAVGHQLKYTFCVEHNKRLEGIF